MWNRKRFLALLMALAVFFPFAPAQAKAAAANPHAGQSIVVNPISALNSDFIMGADISMLAQIEKNGGMYYDDLGNARDCLAILKEHGLNWVRLRLWNDPTTDAEGKVGKDTVILNGQPAPEGTPAGAGNCDLETILPVMKRAKALGFKILLDFHYSDFWADPGKQVKPKAWKNLAGTDLQDAVYDYTKAVIERLKTENVLPDMVQIGNEVSNGMLHPDGQISGPGGMAGFAALVKKGIQAVRDADPFNGDEAEKIKIMIHLDRGGNNALYRSVFDGLTGQGVTDFDVIGLSYYPYWHGTLEELKANMIDISARYGKEVVIAETAYAFTLSNADNTSNNFRAEQEAIGGYQASAQGQATFIRSVPYTPQPTEIEQAIVSYHVDDSGKLHMMPFSRASGNQVVFISNHLSNFAVGYHPVAFKDTSDAKEESEIAFIAARHIAAGFNGKFHPGARITRAEFVAMLANMMVARMDGYKGKASFSDVPANAWYAPVMAWAKETGLLSGNMGKASPTGLLTREQMAVILQRFAAYAHLKLPKPDIEVSFADSQLMSSWAKDAAEAIYRAGLVPEAELFFNPKGAITRGEAAKILFQLIQKVTQ